MTARDEIADYGLSLSAGMVYALIYLYSAGDLGFAAAGWDWRVVPRFWERMLTMRGQFHFEAIAVLEAGYLVFLLSPLNIAVAVLLGLLLAANLHGALYLRHSTCRRSNHRGWLAAALPALFAGGACCAPSLLILLGIPALGSLAGLFPWLLLVSVAALTANRYWQRRQGAAPWLAGVL